MSKVGIFCEESQTVCKAFRHGSLFSGIGGFDLAAQWMGWENMFHCEINEFCNRVLNHYWPNAKSYKDIKTTDFTIWRGLIDVLSGGFPCQPFSSSGERLGTEDDRHLWPEMLRAIREISPRWVVGENVRGLTNWNGGLVFDQIQSDLETEGYEVLPFLLPASAVNAPHRRDRIWFVAYSTSFGHEVGYQESSVLNTQALAESSRFGDAGEITNTGVSRQPRQGWTQGSGHKKTDRNGKASWSDDAGGWPVESPVCAGNDGISGKLDGISLSDWREQSLGGSGNAIVPQVVYQIFKSIEQYELLTPSS